MGNSPQQSCQYWSDSLSAALVLGPRSIPQPCLAANDLLENPRTKMIEESNTTRPTINIAGIELMRH
jgi:hypothetical protein